MIVLYAFLFHEGLNPWVPVPLFTLVLISADVDISIREEGRHFSKKSIEKLIDLVARGIQGRFKNSGCTFDRIRTRRTAEFGITNQPTGAVSGDIKLWHDTDAARAGIINNLSDLILRVVETI